MVKKYKAPSLFGDKEIHVHYAQIIAIKELITHRAIYASDRSREQVYKLGILYGLSVEVIGYMENKSKGKK